MNRQEALRRASREVDLPIKTVDGTHWKLYVPWKCTDPAGPSTGPLKYLSQSTAFQVRAAHVAAIALHFMGFEGEEFKIGDAEINSMAHQNPWHFRTARELLRHAINEIERVKNAQDL